MMKRIRNCVVGVFVVTAIVLSNIPFSTVATAADNPLISTTEEKLLESSVVKKIKDISDGSDEDWALLNQTALTNGNILAFSQSLIAEITPAGDIVETIAFERERPDDSRYYKGIREVFEYNGQYIVINEQMNEGKYDIELVVLNNQLQVVSENWIGDPYIGYVSINQLSLTADGHVMVTVTSNNLENKRTVVTDLQATVLFTTQDYTYDKKDEIIATYEEAGQIKTIVNNNNDSSKKRTVVFNAQTGAFIAEEIATGDLLTFLYHSAIESSFNKMKQNLTNKIAYADLVFGDDPSDVATSIVIFDYINNKLLFDKIINDSYLIYATEIADGEFAFTGENGAIGEPLVALTENGELHRIIPSVHTGDYAMVASVGVTTNGTVYGLQSESNSESIGSGDDTGPALFSIGTFDASLSAYGAVTTPTFDKNNVIALEGKYSITNDMLEEPTFNKTVEWFAVPVANTTDYTKNFQQGFDSVDAANRGAIQATIQNDVLTVDHATQNANYWYRVSITDGRNTHYIVNKVTVTNVFSNTEVVTQAVNKTTGSVLYSETITAANTVGVSVDTIDGTVISSTVDGTETIENNPINTFATMTVDAPAITGGWKLVSAATQTAVINQAGTINVVFEYEKEDPITPEKPEFQIIASDFTIDAKELQALQDSGKIHEGLVEKANAQVINKLTNEMTVTGIVVRIPELPTAITEETELYDVTFTYEIPTTRSGNATSRATNGTEGSIAYTVAMTVNKTQEEQPTLPATGENPREMIMLAGLIISIGLVATICVWKKKI